MRFMPSRALLGLVSLASVVVAPRALAQCTMMRPTDPTGQFSYEGAAADFHDAGPNVRIWYALEGEHAPDDIGEPGLPAIVDLAGSIAEDALVSYADWGFAPPLSDGSYDPCASNGGDGRLDIYLADFVGADGSAAVEQCEVLGTKVACAGFIVIENDFDGGGGYPSLTAAVQTVVPHEIFHLVQNAYDADLDPWFSEGSAQWAADRLQPELDDLEGFLPYYFAEIDKPIDQPAGGVVAGFLYGTAVWPVFLDERFGGHAIILDILEALPTQPGDVLDATDVVLSARGSSLGETFGEFMAHNGATGQRATPGLGYLDAASYPEVEVLALSAEVPLAHDELTAGLTGHFYSLPEGPARLVELDADDSRLGAYVMPLEGDKPQLDAAVLAPATFEGAAMVVVFGKSSSKVDAPFTVLVSEAPDEPVGGAGSQGGAGASPGGGGGGVGGADLGESPDDEDGGCGCSIRGGSSRGGWLVLSSLGLALWRRARRTTEPIARRQGAHGGDER